MGLPVATFQMMTRWSRLPLARVLPSAVNVTHSTEPLWPARTRLGGWGPKGSVRIRVAGTCAHVTPMTITNDARTKDIVRHPMERHGAAERRRARSVFGLRHTVLPIPHKASMTSSPCMLVYLQLTSVERRRFCEAPRMTEIGK